MRRRGWKSLAALGILAIGATALGRRPPGSPEASPAARPLLEGAAIDAETLGILERACRNCHSERMSLPWYGHVPPASWLIHRDVRQARGRADFSGWSGYSAVEKQALLSAIGAAARTGVMPPRRYTLLHRDGQLSPAERERVYRWTRAERARLRRSAPSAEKVPSVRGF